jgi:hypothetical protein
MNGFLTDFWRDTIQVVELLLALVPLVLAAVARLVTVKTKTSNHQSSPAKFSLFEYSPRRYSEKFTGEQILSVKVLTGSAIVTFLSSFYLPTLDTSSLIGAILKFPLVIIVFGGTLLQVGLALSLAFEAIVRRYPNLELWFSDTAPGNGLASLLCLEGVWKVMKEPTARASVVSWLI